MYQKGFSAYRKSAANTLEDKRMILLKLYEGALLFIGCAKRGMMGKSARIRGENISKIMAIINELECALDYEKGGEISTRLSSLYQFVMDRLLLASKNNDIKALEQAEQVISTLKDGFETALKELRRATAPSHIITNMSAPAPERSVQFAL